MRCLNGLTLFASPGVVRFVVVLLRLAPAVFAGPLVCGLILDCGIGHTLCDVGQDGAIVTWGHGFWCFRFGT